jgi:hypothetical protein
MGAAWAHKASNGETDDKLFYDFLRLNGYIRTLERNEKTFVRKKKAVPLTTTSFSNLIKQKCFLTLKTNYKVVCTVT